MTGEFPFIYLFSEECADAHSTADDPIDDTEEHYDNSISVEEVRKVLEASAKFFRTEFFLYNKLTHTCTLTHTHTHTRTCTHTHTHTCTHTHTHTHTHSCTTLPAGSQTRAPPLLSLKCTSILRTRICRRFV